MKLDDLDRVKPQREDGKPLTEMQLEELKTNVRAFLVDCVAPSRIIAMIQAKYNLAKQVAVRYLDVARREMENSTGGIFKEQVESLGERQMRDILASKTSTPSAKVSALKLLNEMSERKRKPREDLEYIQIVVDEEVERMKGLSDKDLDAYIELLSSSTLDEEFDNLVDAKRRGRQYLPERGEEIDPKTLTRKKGQQRKKRVLVDQTAGDGHEV